MSKIDAATYEAALRTLLTELFSEVQGWVLDRNASLLETLAGISAAEASIPVGGRCATLAAQVKHIAFYFDFLDGTLRDPDAPPVDWGEIWRTVGAVDEAEWAGIQDELRASYGRILTLIEDTEEWDNERMLAGSMAVIAHTAYHLGEIRQALCTLRP